MKSLLAIFVLLGLAGLNSASMCKILLRAYYNFKGIGFNDSPNYQLDQNTWIYYRLCTNYNNSLAGACGSDADFGNLVLQQVNPADKSLSCSTLASVEKAPNKKDWVVEHQDYLSVYYQTPQSLEAIEEQMLRTSTPLGAFDNRSNSSGTATTYTIAIDNQVLNSKGINSAAFGLVCNTSLNPADSKFRNQVIDQTLWFFFEGIQACGLDLIEPTVFMRNHIAFPVLIILLSTVALILRRVNERYMMTVFGINFGVFLTLICMADLELQFHFTDSTTNTLLGCCIFVGLIFGAVCFASRNTSIFVLFLGAAISFSYTLMDVLVMVSGQGITYPVFWSIIVFLVIIMGVFHQKDGSYDKYGHLFLVSIDFSFYICMSVAVIVGWYPDLLTIQESKKYFIGLEPRKENWYFLGAQLLMTVVLFVDSYAIAKKSWQEIDQLEENIARDQKDSESHEIHDRSM